MHRLGCGTVRSVDAEPLYSITATAAVLGVSRARARDLIYRHGMGRPAMAGTRTVRLITEAELRELIRIREERGLYPR